MVLGEVRRTFNPEFINRIDEIIVFEALSDDDLRRITRLLVEQLNSNLIDRRLKIRLAADAIDWIIDLTCKDRSYGARPLRRAIQRYIEDPLSRGVDPRRAQAAASSRSTWMAATWPTAWPGTAPTTSRPAAGWPPASNIL